MSKRVKFEFFWLKERGRQYWYKQGRPNVKSTEVWEKGWGWTDTCVLVPPQSHHI